MKYFCDHHKLTSLEYASEYVGGKIFGCRSNLRLKQIIDFPKNANSAQHVQASPTVKRLIQDFLDQRNSEGITQ